MQYTVQLVCDHLAELIVSSYNTNREFSRIDAVDNYQPESLIFITDDSIFFSDQQRPAAIVTDQTIAARLVSEKLDQNLSIIVVTNVRLAQALVKQKFSDYDTSDSEWETVHPSAVVHDSAKLGDNIRIGPNSVIGKNVVVGDNTKIRANCVIEHGVRIGVNCVIHNLVNIGYDCQLGDQVIVRPGTIIGNEGFGFAQDEQRRYHRTPHTGIVEIKDNVQIGSNCNIDRATYGKTVIGKGVKIDALCHIAHNVIVGEDTLFVAQTGIAGSCNIGKRVIASGQTGILDHKTVVDDVVLVHRCGVTEDIPKAGMWAGTPPLPFKEYVRNLNNGKKLARLERKLKDLSDRFDDR